MSDSAPTETRTLAQLHSAIWADRRLNLYAAVLGHRVAGLRARLAPTEVDAWDVLWSGELDDDERAAAPVLVALRERSAFSDWLLGEAAAAFPGWGTLVQSPLGFFALRHHARNLCRARLPNGQAIRIDWMDPEVMDALLPVAAGDQLQRLFTGIEALVTITPQRWVRWSAPVGRLVRQTTDVAT